MIESLLALNALNDLGKWSPNTGISHIGIVRVNQTDKLVFLGPKGIHNRQHFIEMATVNDDDVMLAWY